MNATYALSEREFEAVSCLGAEERFAHFLKRVADWEAVWGLRDEAGWVAATDSDDHSSFPLWPHPLYMASDNVFLAVFPTPALRGIIVSATELATALRQALAAYE